ncbi:MAG: cold shock domain-containing protein [Symploca sp. SIO2C1]|nr:cold shock domain-containing protein [Symploca sp. SIO2C1]
MPNKGKLTTWKDERGFGFIKPDHGGKEIFLHISALKRINRRPKVGDTILYELTTESNGKVRASNASIEGVIPETSDVHRNQLQVQATKKSPTNFRTSPLPKTHKSKRGRPVKILISLGVIAFITIIAKGFSASNSPSPSTPNPDTVISNPNTSINQPGCNIKGNISHNTGNKVYHIPGMEDYESTVIDPLKGEKWFCSESEAIANGWRKAPR